MKGKVAGWIACRAEGLVIRHEFDDLSARRFRGRIHNDAGPFHTCTLRHARRAEQKSDAQQRCKRRERRPRRSHIVRAAGGKE